MLHRVLAIGIQHGVGFLQILFDRGDPLLIHGLCYDEHAEGAAPHHIHQSIDPLELLSIFDGAGHALDASGMLHPSHGVEDSPLICHLQLFHLASAEIALQAGL